MTLTEFLLARIAEDEQRARDDGADAMVGARWKGYPEAAYNELQALTLARSRRVLAECEAKRRIVEMMGRIVGEFALPVDQRLIWPDLNRRERHHANVVLDVMAEVYADHPDYREEWRP